MPKYRRKQNQSKGKSNKKSNNNRESSSQSRKTNKLKNQQLKENNNQEESIKTSTNITVTSGAFPESHQSKNFVDNKEIDLDKQIDKQINRTSKNEHNIEESEIFVCELKENNTEEDSCGLSTSFHINASSTNPINLNKTGAKISVDEKGERPSFLHQSHQQHQFVNSTLQDVHEVKEADTDELNSSNTIPEPTSPPILTSSLSSSDSDTLTPSHTESPDRETLLTGSTVPLIDGNNKISADDVIHVNTSNLPICDNRNAARANSKSFENTDNSNCINVEADSCSNNQSSAYDETLINKPVKHPIVQEIITVSYPYRVESPKPMKTKAGNLNTVKKSRSLDDDELLIQEISDNSSMSDSNDNQPVVSEAESEIDSEANEISVKDNNLTILSVQTLPLNSVSTEIPKLESVQKSNSNDSNDFKNRRAKKRAALESHFLPQFLNPRYLDSITEEGSDLSDVERKSDSGEKVSHKGRSKSCSDIEDDILFIDNETLFRKANAIFPKSNLDFSQKKKHTSNLRPPKTGVIREESPCYIVEAKIVEQTIPIEENCFVWTTGTIAQSDAAEVIYLDSASSSSSDIVDLENTGADDADIEDLNDDTDVRIETPNIDIYDDERRIFRKSETPTIITDESFSTGTASITEAEFSDDAIKNENRPPVEWETNATKNIFNDENIHNNTQKEISRGDNTLDGDHQTVYLDQTINNNFSNIESDISSNLIKNCLYNQNRKLDDQLNDSNITQNVRYNITSPEENLKLVEINQKESDRKIQCKNTESDEKTAVNIAHCENDLENQNELRLLKIKEIANKCIEEIVKECEFKINDELKLKFEKNSDKLENIFNENNCIENISNKYLSAHKSEIPLDKNKNNKYNRNSDHSKSNQIKNNDELIITDLDAVEPECTQIENKKLIDQFLKKGCGLTVEKCDTDFGDKCRVSENPSAQELNNYLTDVIKTSKILSNNSESEKIETEIQKSELQLQNSNVTEDQNSKLRFSDENSLKTDDTPPQTHKHLVVFDPSHVFPFSSEMSANSSVYPTLTSNSKNSSIEKLTHSSDIDNNTLTEINLNNNNTEYSRQDSSSSHCSDHSHSTDHSQCTAIDKSSSPRIDLDIGQCISESPHRLETNIIDNISETASTTKTLRQICIDKLTSMPYGKIVLEELALVAESLSDLASQHQKEKLLNKGFPDMPYPVPELPQIKDLEISVPTNEIGSKIRLSSLPPSKLKSPPPPPIPEPPKNDTWFGVPTQEDPKIFVCFSPAQRNYLQETKTTNEHIADHLLDMHKKFVERRGYHELTTQQVDVINEKSQNHCEKNILSTKNKKNEDIVLSPLSPQYTHSQQSPMPPPPPLPRFARSFNNNENEIVNNMENNDKNNHRLLAIIRDSKQCPNSEVISKIKAEQIAKIPSENQTKNYYQCDQQKQTLEKNESKILEQQKILSSSSSSTTTTKLTESKTLKEKNMPLNTANEKYFEFSNDDIFNSQRKRFSNIETTPYYCSQLRQTLPKRYSNIEMSSYESKKKVENGDVVYEYSDSSKQKYVNRNDDQSQKTQTNFSEYSHSDKIMSDDINLNSNLRSEETPNTKSDLNLISHNVKNREDNIKQKTQTDEISYEEFRQRAKDSAKKARDEFFKRENFFKGFDDISKYFGDYFTDGKCHKTNENKYSTVCEIPVTVDKSGNYDASNTEKKKVYTEKKLENEFKSILKEQKSNQYAKSTQPQAAISDQNVYHIPITFEENFKTDKNSQKFQRTQSLNQDNFHKEKLQEKRLSSQNLDEWLHFTNEFGASSENITKPFQKEVEILYKGRPSNAKAPRLSVSTSNLATESKKKEYYRPSSRTDYCHFSSSQSSIDQTPITCYVSPYFPKRSSLPKEISDQQTDYIKMKEMELQAEFEKLENERRRLIEEMDLMRKSPLSLQQHQNNLRKDVFHYRSCRLPTLSEEEAFRQQMHDEWLNKVAEREERRLHKIIKISKPSNDLVTESQNQTERRKSSATVDISDEFLKRVKERRSKLHMPSDSDWESGAESQPISSNNNKDENSQNEANVKVIEGKTETDLSRLPKHLREFAEFTNQKIDKHEEMHSCEEKEYKDKHYSSIVKDELNTKMSKVTTSTTTSTTKNNTNSNDELLSQACSFSSSAKNNVNNNKTEVNKSSSSQQRNQEQQEQRQRNQSAANKYTTTVLRSKKQTQSTQTTITTTRKRQTKFILSPNRRSWSESDLLKEIDKDLVLSKGFLFGHGVWSPANRSTETLAKESNQRQQNQNRHHQQQQKQDRSENQQTLENRNLKDNQCPTPPPPPSKPIWTPQPSPTTGRKEYRPVKFESPNLPRRYVRQDSAPVAPPWSYTESKPFPGYQTTSTSCTNLSNIHSGDETNLFKTKINSNSTNSLIQRKKESLFGKNSSYSEIEHPKIQKNEPPPIVRPNEVIYSVKHEYMSEPESEYDQPKKMAQLGRRQYEGIGPTTKDGMPIVLRSEVKENNQHKWYKRMYNTLHKAKDHDDYVTIRYKTRRGRYPYKTNGYMSEPEPNYDSDYNTMKYHTVERSRCTPTPGTTYHDDRNYGTMPNPVKSGFPSYKNQPGRIENYIPGRSSVAEKERKEWWDEVMEIFNGQLEQQKLSNSYTEGYLSRALKEQGYESDSNLIFRKKGDSQIAPLSPVEQKQAYKNVQAGGEPPLQGFRKPAPEKPRESSRRYFEGDVNIHYKTPIRYEYKESIPEEELARRQAETMKKLYQEERRRKYLQELQDMNKRRHTDNFTPSQKSPIPLNRYDDFITDVTPKLPNTTIYPKTVARALYNFQGQTARELTFKKGDVIYIRRQIDKNWYEGEHNAMIGLLPANYVEIITKDGVRQPPKKPSEGQARAKFNFQAQSAIELSLNKGELVTLTRRVDENWFEGRIANRKGIFPVSYVEVLTDIGSEDNIQQPIQSKPVGAPASHSLITYPNTTATSPSLDTLRTNINNEFNTLTNGHPANTILRETKSIHKTEVLHVDTNTEPIAYRALYKYRPQNNDELELQEGDIVYVLEKCDDGWYVGTSQRTGYFGTFPGNYVERI